MRAALLPTPGDPAMLAYWLRNFATWRDEVDELVVLVNGLRGAADLAYDREAVAAAGGRLVEEIELDGHAKALRALVAEHTAADLVVLCEDDAYVRRPGEVDAAFRAIEAGATDIVGCPRGEDYAGQWADWGPFAPGDTIEVDHGLWPAFLFARRADLLATRQKYRDFVFNLGDVIPGLGPVTPAMCEHLGLSPRSIHLDTFFVTTFELRSRGLRTELRHHVRVYDPAATAAWLLEDPPFVHVTGLSTLPAVLHRYPIDGLADWQPGGGKWTRRAAWWQRVMDAVPDAPHAQESRAALADFRSRAGIDPAEEARWDALFAGWVTWDEVGTRVRA